MSGLSAQATATATLLGQGVVFSGITAAGAASAGFNTQPKRIEYCTLGATAAGSAGFNAQYLTQASMTAAVAGTADFGGSLAYYTTLNAAAQAQAIFMKGGDRMNFLPAAYDRVIRPEEPRGVIRFEEQRAALWM